MGLAIQSVMTAIAGLSISGVRINTFSTEKAQVDARECPVLFPEPTEFVSGFTLVRDSLGLTTAAKKTVTYTLKYTFCYKSVGQGRLGFGEYSDMVTKAAAILDAVIADDTITGQVLDIVPESIGYFGLVNDPAGNPFFGCQLTFRVSEFVN